MNKTKVKLKHWNLLDHLKTEKDCRLFIEAAFEEAGDDATYLAAALGEVARARGMMRIARDSGLAREALYRALSPSGNPSFATVLKVTKALGMRLTVLR